MKYNIYLFLINFIISILLALTSSNFLLTFINSIFTIGMIYLLFGLLSFIWAKGFFDITLFSFKKIASFSSKNKTYEDENENFENTTLQEYVNREKNVYGTNYLLINGFLTSIISLVISLFMI